MVAGHILQLRRMTNLSNKTKKRKEGNESQMLCEGVLLADEFYEKKENRLLTLLIKGFIVYLLTMGGLGFYLSTLNVEYNEVLCHLVVLVMAFVCAMLYYRLLVENTGYFIMIVIFGFLVYVLKDYINSGFYAVVNLSVNNAAQYFNVDIQRIYTERIANRYQTVTFFVIFLGVVLDILLNVYISRRMQYVTAFCIVMFLNLIPLYMVLEPNLLYAGMVLVGISLAVVFKSSRHYSPQVSVKRSNVIFAPRTISKRKKISELFYVYDAKALFQAGIITTITVIALIIGVNAIWPKDSFNVGYEMNKYKRLTNAGVSTFFVDGFEGLFSQSEDVGGLNSGSLGNVSSVRLDHKTDLVVQLTPFDYGRVYLRNYVGQEYMPYENSWFTADIKIFSNVSPEAKALERSYDEKSEYSARGVMKIRVVDPIVEYGVPYYYKNIKRIYEAPPNETDLYSIEYYPSFASSDAVLKKEDYNGYMPYTAADLYVPDENVKTIAKFVKDNKIEGSKEEIVEAVIDYFSENIPYTVRPGKVPKNKDFVNYFLEEGRKGYCSYFASAAVLIYRYLGIPARYVEGYALDYMQLATGELVEGEQYEDYYDGYSELGKTALVEVNVTDADAHAWVEVYFKDKGWQVVEVTPAGTSEDVDDDFWSLFSDTFDNGDEETVDDGGIGLVNWEGPKKFLRFIGYFIVCFIAIVFISFLLFRGRKYIVYLVKYCRSNTNDKLILKYSGICKKISKRDEIFRTKINYRDQIEYLSDGHRTKKCDLEYLRNNTENVIFILEKAGFSNVELTGKEIRTVVAWLKMAT